MLTRREFLSLLAKGSAGLALPPYTYKHAWANQTGTLVNDIHSQLNPTYVDRVVPINSPTSLQAVLAKAQAEGKTVSIAGGRHSMGGQQFGAGTVLIDTRPMNRILNFDVARGVVEVEAGIQWPGLVDNLIKLQEGKAKQWGIIQKQTGADRLSLGGALASNIHGRGLTLKPIVGDVEAFTLMAADGKTTICSRAENSELFRLAIGGYGLFGVVTSVKLRLMPRTKLERRVEIIDIDQLMQSFEKRVALGYLYGDCQFSIDIPSDGYLKRGVFSCYRKLPDNALMPAEQKELSEDNWRELYYLAHTDTKSVFDRYSSYYLSTSGQKYWSDTHQLSVYINDYHQDVDYKLKEKTKATEMITELYVPRTALPRFMNTIREDFRKHNVKVIYGTIRLIEQDTESFLAWAKQSYACIVMNLHITHDKDGINKATDDFRRLIDRAIELGGSYFLTYHRWARRDQAQTCYPQMAEFLKLKKKYDPAELFQSDWYRHYKTMFADRI